MVGSFETFDIACFMSFAADSLAPIDPYFQQLLSLYQTGDLDSILAALPALQATNPTSADFWHLAGVIFSEAGQVEQARIQLEKALQLAPDKPEILNTLGIFLASLEQNQAALALFQKADLIQPNNPRILTNCAHCYLRLEQYELALDFYQRVIKLEPHVPENWLDAGKALYRARHLKVAIQCLTQAIALKAPPETGFWLGRAYADTGDWNNAELWLRRSLLGGFLDGAPLLAEFYRQAKAFEQAQRVFEPLLQSYPENPELLHIWAQLLLAQDAYLAAQVMLKKALALAPQEQDIQISLAYLPLYQNQPESALQALLALIPTMSENHRLWHHLGNIYVKLERFEEAEEMYLKAIQLDANYAKAYANLGMVYTELNRLDLALKYQEQSLYLDPAYARGHLHRAQVLLHQNRYREGWAEYEWRHQLLPGHWPAPAWQGQSLAGLRVIVLSEQGFGDTLQFSRFLRQLYQEYGQPELFLQCPAVLLPIMAGLPVLKGLTSAETENLKGFDYAIRLLSLPHYLDITPDKLGSGPYLQLPAGESAESLPSHLSQKLVQAQTQKRLRVGLVWSAADHHDTQPKRSLHFSQLEALIAQFADISFFCLQLGASHQQLLDSDYLEQVTDCAPALMHFGISAQILAELDLLITVDTAMAHLAGSLGLPAWVLLPFAPDWRWQLQGETTPWYPHLRLFRQKQRGAWQPVLEQVQSALCELLEQN
jgi:tetratricopeptide (TPR) repeat protein